jgi:hypothetical protein
MEPVIKNTEIWFDNTSDQSKHYGGVQPISIESKDKESFTSHVEI